MSGHIGINGVPKGIVAGYIGVNDQPKLLLGGWIGVNGAPKKFYELSPDAYEYRTPGTHTLTWDLPVGSARIELVSGVGGVRHLSAWANDNPETRSYPAPLESAISSENGRIYVLEGDEIHRYSSITDRIPNTKDLDGLSGAGLSVVGGTLYVLSSHSSIIYRYSSWSDDTPDQKHFIHGSGLSVVGGAIYIIDSIGNRIARYRSWSDTTPDYKNVPSGSWRGISVVDGATIYIIDSSGNRIARYHSWSDTTPDYKDLGSPNGVYNGLDVDSSGIYLIDTANSPDNRIIRYGKSSENRAGGLTRVIIDGQTYTANGVTGSGTANTETRTIATLDRGDTFAITVGASGGGLGGSHGSVVITPTL